MCPPDALCKHMACGLTSTDSLCLAHVFVYVSNFTAHVIAAGCCGLESDLAYIFCSPAQRVSSEQDTVPADAVLGMSPSRPLHSQGTPEVMLLRT